eukprot:GHVN01012612.1.p1 GENE.GHVN01012612.1~~GHVN01012612.1.p1  ORF type:complete len:364 (-),score=32.42 GHVN01012612.1:1129-2220(-)
MIGKQRVDVSRPVRSVPVSPPARNITPSHSQPLSKSLSCPGSEESDGVKTKALTTRPGVQPVPSPVNYAPCQCRPALSSSDDVTAAPRNTLGATDRNNPSGPAISSGTPFPPTSSSTTTPSTSSATPTSTDPVIPKLKTPTPRLQAFLSQPRHSHQRRASDAPWETDRAQCTQAPVNIAHSPLTERAPIVRVTPTPPSDPPSHQASRSSAPLRGSGRWSQPILGKPEGGTDSAVSDKPKIGFTQTLQCNGHPGVLRHMRHKSDNPMPCDQCPRAFEAMGHPRYRSSLGESLDRMPSFGQLKDTFFKINADVAPPSKPLLFEGFSNDRDLLTPGEPLSRLPTAEFGASSLQGLHEFHKPMAKRN